MQHVHVMQMSVGVGSGGSTSSPSALKFTALNPQVNHSAQGAWTDELVVQPRPLTPTYFSDRSDAVDVKASEQVFKALSKAKLLNATGYLIEDPRYARALALLTSSWRSRGHA